MDAKKEKGQHNLPDTRLAKVFNFTSEDLAANRLGFITSHQELNTPLWQRRLFRRLSAMFNLKFHRQRFEVGKRCGRVEIQHETKTIYNRMRRNITEMVHVYTMSIKDKHFKLNQAQYYAVTNQFFYIVYYDMSNNRIVALERVDNDC